MAPYSPPGVAGLHTPDGAGVWPVRRADGFRDINPVAPTHVLLIPKQRDGLTKLGAATAEHAAVLGHMMAVAAPAVAKQEGLDDFRVVTNCGESASQTVLYARTTHGALAVARARTRPRAPAPRALTLCLRAPGVRVRQSPPLACARRARLQLAARLRATIRETPDSQQLLPQAAMVAVCAWPCARHCPRIHSGCSRPRAPDDSRRVIVMESEELEAMRSSRQ